MGVTGKMSVEVDIKSSGDVFHELFGAKHEEVTNVLSHSVHSFEVHEGAPGQVGSIFQWDYTCGGKKCVAKELVEEIDKENKMVRFKCLEGTNALEGFKSMSIVLQVIPKGEFDAVIWTLEFERFDDHGPYPTELMDFCVTSTRDVEAHHLTNA